MPAITQLHFKGLELMAKKQKSDASIWKELLSSTKCPLVKLWKIGIEIQYIAQIENYVGGIKDMCWNLPKL